MTPKPLTILILILALLCGIWLAFPARTAWVWQDGQLVETEPPKRLEPLTAQQSADMNQDGIEERLDLHDGRLNIYTQDQPAAIWQSPEGWEVRQAEMTDFNRDGLPEAALLVWREHRSWPVDEWMPNSGRVDEFQDKSGRSCQMILIGWISGEYREVWAGSALAEPIDNFRAADLDGDGYPELITLESHYDDFPPLPSRALCIWEWNGFGFTLLQRLPGAFADLDILPLPPNSSIISADKFLNLFITK